MKTFLVFATPDEGQTYGAKVFEYQAEEMDDTSNYRGHSVAWPHAKSFELPDGVDKDCAKLVFVEEVPGTDDMWTKDGEEPVFVDPQDPTWTYVPAVTGYPAHYEIQEDPALVASKSAAQKADQIAVLYKQMETDVLTGMAQVFGTLNTDSAAAYERTWVLMTQKPELFSVAGLKAKFAVGGLSIGDALDTNEKVVAYASAKIAEVEAYGVQRLQRIEQFYADRAAVEGA